MVSSKYPDLYYSIDDDSFSGEFENSICIHVEPSIHSKKISTIQI